MRSKRRLTEAYIIAIVTVIAVTVAGCSTSGCLENRSSIPLARFYSSTTHESLSIDSVAIGGVGASEDSLLNTPGQATAKVYLPLRARQQSTSFYFRYLNKALDYPQYIDTITISYEARPHFVSEECGAMYFYEIKSLTHTTNLIDSVAVTDSVVNNVDIERIAIFYPTREEVPDDEDNGDNDNPQLQ